MAELNLKQISDRLNEMFKGEGRKLVFWYDDRKEFADDINEIELLLENATVYRLESDNQFYTKRFLERENTGTNYLIYAPFPKPAPGENHLEDTLLYSERFYAERASLVCSDLGLDRALRPFISAHVSFFNNKVRDRKFRELDINPKTEQNLLLGMLAVLSGAATASLEDVVRAVLTDGDLDDNKFLGEFEKHDLLELFWGAVRSHFGCSDQVKSLSRFLATLFTTAAAAQVKNGIQLPSRDFLTTKAGTCIAFLNSMANDRRYQKRYDDLSKTVFKGSHLESSIKGQEPDDLVECDLFVDIDKIIIHWITERLNNEDADAKLGGYDIPALCTKRLNSHFAMRRRLREDSEKDDNPIYLIYRMLENAHTIVCAAGYQPAAGLTDIVEQYIQRDMLIDQAYRKFYFYYDELNGIGGFDGLQSKVENIYTNVYLEKLLPAWNEGIQKENLSKIPHRQYLFFMNRSSNLSKERTVVIISDALRYEVGEELFRECRMKPNWDTLKPSYMISLLPSVTSLGMAALLPHGKIELTADSEVRVDGSPCVTTEQRESLLQKKIPQSRAFRYEMFSGMKKEEIRDLFKGLELVYIYHNKIDAQGDNAQSERDVFNACQDAVNEIRDLIHRISTNANTYHFLVTADHGFIYKRDALTETDKISVPNSGEDFYHRRAIISDKPVVEVGVNSKPLAEILGNDDPRYVSYPVSSNVFKTAGAGLNYVHGGSSPQEMIVPLLEVKVGRAKIDKEYAKIKLVSSSRKVTNGTLTAISFAQTEPVSDRVQAGVYRVYFRDAKGEKVSNEIFHTADSREAEERDRNFTLKFNFKNQKYKISEEYFLVIANKDGDELERHSFKFDIPFYDDYDF